MATPVVNPGAQVSGQDDDFLKFVRQTIAEEVAKTPAAPGSVQAPLPAQAAAPISLNLNGQSFTYNTPEEASRAMQNVVNAFQSELQRVQQVQNLPTGHEVTGQEEAPQFSINTFVEKMTSNPVEAFDYVDKYRYGVDNPTQAVKDAISTKKQLDDVNRVLAVYQFRDAHPEFNADGNPQAANAIYQIMQANGLPFTAQGLESAYAVGRLHGVFPAPQAPQFQPTAQNPFPGQNPGVQPQFGQPSPQAYYPPVLPPPAVGRSAQEVPADLFSLAQDMSAEQIEAVFRRFQS